MPRWFQIALCAVLLVPAILVLRMVLFGATSAAAGVLDTAFGKEGIGFLIIFGGIAAATFAFWPTKTKGR